MLCLSRQKYTFIILSRQRRVCREKLILVTASANDSFRATRVKSTFDQYNPTFSETSAFFKVAGRYYFLLTVQSFLQTKTDLLNRETNNLILCQYLVQPKCNECCLVFPCNHMTVSRRNGLLSYTEGK